MQALVRSEKPAPFAPGAEKSGNVAMDAAALLLELEPPA